MSDNDNVHQLPEPGVILDLDLEQRPAKDVKPPFVVKVGGRKIPWADPAEIDWKKLASVQIPADMLRVALSNEDRAYLNEQDLPAWKFNKLLEAYSTHYDFEEKIREAKQRAEFAGLS